MAMLVSAGFWLRCVNALPNVWTGSLHGAALVVGCLLEVIPGLGEPFFLYGQILSQRSIQRGEWRQQAIEGINKADNLAKISQVQSQNREAADVSKTKQTTAPTLIETAKHKSEAKIIDHKVATEGHVIARKTSADKAIMDKKTTGRERVIAAYEKQEQELQGQKTTHRLKEQETVHRTSMFSLTQAHFEKMLELNTNLAGAADTNATAAQGHEMQMQRTQKSILGLTKATGAVIEAQTALNKALGDYDTLVAQGEITMDHAIQIKDAMITAMKAEGQLDTVIEASQIKDKSELKIIYKQDVAAKNKELDGVLAKCSKQTLGKFAELITTEIHAQQKTINALTSPEDKGRAQVHLEKLNALLEQTNHIQPTSTAANAEKNRLTS